MLPKHSFLQLVPPRLKATVERLERMIWGGAEPLRCEETSGQTGAVSWEEAVRLPRGEIQEYPHQWGELFEQRWFRLELPSVSGSEPVFLHWRDQAEATAYIDGVPYCGFDVAHRYAPLPAGTREVWMESHLVHSATWHPGTTAIGARGSRLEGGFLVRRNEEAWGGYHDFTVLYDCLMAEQSSALPGNPPEAIGYQPPMEEMLPMQRRLLRRLDEAVDRLDLEGLAEFRRALRAVYRDFAAADARLRATFVGHAHLDLVWLWPERIGTAKAVHTWATVDHLMDRYPELRFSFSQPFCYRAVQKANPALYDRVKQRIGDGRWEATGGLDVESDTLLPCGEALLRAFLIGQDGFREISGKPSRSLWLPDTFGFSACLPQLMKLAGVDYFFTTKLTWGALTRFPYSSFVWKGNDGSEVLAYLTQGVGVNGQATAGELRAAADAYRQADVHDEVLLPTGFGDGGGGPTAEMCERVRRLGELAGLPKGEWGLAEPFFDRLREQEDRLPRYQGELLLEYHRGIFTTHGDLKEVFRAAERGLQVLEAARCAGSGQPIDEEMWRRVIFAQFHDHIPGSSIWEVYAEGIPELRTIGENAWRQTKLELETEGAKGKAVFNPLPFARNWIGPGGEGRENVVYRLPPLTGKPVGELEPVVDIAEVRSGEDWLDNGMVRAVFDENGNIAELVVEGRRLAIREGAGALFLMPDRAHCYDAWEIDRQTMSLGRPVDGPVRRTVENETHRAAITFERSVGEGSRIATRYSLESGSGALRVDYDIDWREKETLLKVAFPTGYSGSMARFGQPFGSVIRSQQSGRIADEAQWEVPGSRWAAVCDDGEREGLFVATEAKYGFSCREGLLSVSLLRSARITGEDNRYGPVLPKALRAGAPAEPFSDQGRHRVRLAIGLYDTCLPREAQAAALADILFTPFVEYDGGGKDCGWLGLTGGDSLQPAWARPLEAGRWVMRLHETLGRRGESKIRLREGWRAARCDARGQAEQAWLGDGDPIQFRPYEVVSLRVERS